MSYCINPVCSNPSNPDNADLCQSCQKALLINNRYQLIQPLSNNKYTCTRVFEIVDQENEGKSKILKAIHNDGTQLPDGTELFAKLVNLFQREKEVLIHLDHQGIPQGEDYFSLSFSDSNEVHCLVMEKIPGENLEQWLQKHGPLKEKQALKWLQQLAEILREIHRRKWFHRDIKPSNIILRRNGRLVLIDFGTVRQITGKILNSGRMTQVWSVGYTPREQIEGQAVLQSDFYALGRTFVHLLTGKHPDEINPISDWRQSTKHRMDDSLVTLIDDLMADSSSNRPQNAQAILDRLNVIQQEIELEKRKKQEQRKRWLIGGIVVVPVLAVAAIAIDLLRPQTCNSERDDYLSCGEESLTDSYAPPEKFKGLQQVRDGHYIQAVDLLEKAWKKPLYMQPDPETLIYLNNAKINSQQTPNPKGKVYTIAAIAPLANTPDKQTSNQGLEMLRGVAHAQDEAIKGGINLKVLIADDGNSPNQAKQISEKLVNKPDILGVVGSYTSEVTKKVLPIFQQNRLVFVSGTASSEDLKSDIFFRTVPSNKKAGEDLAEYLLSQLPQARIAVFWVQDSTYSKSLTEEFSRAFGTTRMVPDQGVFNLSRQDFNALDALETAKKQGATAIVLIPNGGTTPDALNNALKVIKSNNNSNLIMLGGDVLYTPEIRDDVGEKAFNHLVLAIPWHRLSSPNPEFLKSAKNLWQRGEVSWRTATIYDSTRVLIEAIKQKPSREGVREILSQNNFKVKESATGNIKFQNGDRANPTITLVTVAPNCAPASGYSFVPIDYLRGAKCFQPNLNQ